MSKKACTRLDKAAATMSGHEGFVIQNLESSEGSLQIHYSMMSTKRKTNNIMVSEPYAAGSCPCVKGNTVQQGSFIRAVPELESVPLQDCSMVVSPGGWTDRAECLSSELNITELTHSLPLSECEAVSLLSHSLCLSFSLTPLSPSLILSLSSAWCSKGDQDFLTKSAQTSEPRASALKRTRERNEKKNVCWIINLKEDIKKERKNPLKFHLHFNYIVSLTRSNGAQRL